MPVINGQHVGNIGFGLAELTRLTRAPTEEQAFAAMRAALDAGCNCWNAAPFYGTPENNSWTLLGKYYEEYPEDVDKIVLNMKGGKSAVGWDADCRPENLKQEIDSCLKVLGKGKIDMFEPARRDTKVPLAETLEFLEEYVKQGKIGGVALSEVNANTIREAAKITKIVAVEIELSLWHTDPLTNGIAQACYELQIPIIAYSPLGKGFLTGTIKSLDDIAPDDYRRILPRFQEPHFETNIRLVEELKNMAAKKGCTAPQLAINWLVTLGKRPGMPDIVPIPGSSSAERVKENSAEVELTEEDMQVIDSILEKFHVSGDRYHPHGMKLVDL